MLNKKINAAVEELKQIYSEGDKGQFWLLVKYFEGKTFTEEEKDDIARDFLYIDNRELLVLEDKQEEFDLPPLVEKEESDDV